MNSEHRWLPWHNRPIKKRCIIFKNFQVFLSLNLALHFVYFSTWFWNFMSIELPWNHFPLEFHFFLRVEIIWNCIYEIISDCFHLNSSSSSDCLRETEHERIFLLHSFHFNLRTIHQGQVLHLQLLLHALLLLVNLLHLLVLLLVNLLPALPDPHHLLFASLPVIFHPIHLLWLHQAEVG